MRPTILIAACALILSQAAAQAADPDSDLDRIPDAAMQPDTLLLPSAAPDKNRIYLEDAVTVPSWRSALPVPLPNQPHPSAQNRADLDIRTETTLTDRLTAAYSGRLNYLTDYSVDQGSPRNVRNDLREGYLTWNPAGDSYLDLGRVNQRDDVAYGHNPTDFFRTGAVVDPFSADPRVLREDRLGALMLRGQTVWSAGSATLLYAPKVATKDATYSTDRHGLEPGFDRTNAANRWLAKTSLELANDLAPEVLVYGENGHVQYGLNLTRGVGDATTLFVEWSGGRHASLAAEAYKDGLRTGLFPSGTPFLFGGDTADHFQNDVAVGASYTFPIHLTLTVEYDYNQAGFGRGDFTHWYALGAAVQGNVPALDQLWQIRNFTLDQQDTLARNRIFLRAAWQDAIIRDLDLTALTATNVYDASTLAQLSGEYHLNAHWSAGFIAIANLGGTRSEYGSLPEAGSLLLDLVRYF